MAKNLIGNWAFLIGVALAVIAGVFAALEIVDLNDTILASVIIALGVIIGVLNISRAETASFLLAGISIIIAIGLGSVITVPVPQLSPVLLALLLIIVPATIVVAVKSAIEMAKK